MLKKVKLTTELQTLTENGEDTIRSEAEAELRIEEQGLMLRYAEPENNGTAALIISNSLVHLQRQGRIRSRLTFIEQKLIPAEYHTPHGELHFDLFTHSRRETVTAEKGEIILKYSVLQDDRHAADNLLTVSWTEL